MNNPTLIAAALHSSLCKKSPISYRFSEDEVSYVEILWPSEYEVFKEFCYRKLGSSGSSGSTAALYNSHFLNRLKAEFGFTHKSSKGLSKPKNSCRVSSAVKLLECLKVQPKNVYFYTSKEIDLIRLVFPKVKTTVLKNGYHQIIPSLTAGELISSAELLVRDDRNPSRSKDDLDKPIAGALLDFSRALTEISKLATFGAKKYKRSSWIEVNNGQERYTDAMLRHLLKEAIESKDPETEIEHDVAVAWNALARLELRLRDNTDA